MKKFFNMKNINKIGILFITVIMVFNLFVLRIGVEDNGSLSYTLKNMGMYDANSASGSGYYSPVFGVDNAGFNYASGNLIYSLVKTVVAALGGTSVWVYIPTVIYFAIFMLGVYLLLKMLKSEYDWNNILVIALIAVILCDAGYIAYLNTPYTIAPVISFMPLFIYSVLLLAKTKSYKSLVLEIICSVFIFNSNVIFSVVGILYAVYSLRFITFNKSILWKFVSVVCSVILLVSNFVVVNSYKNDSSLYNACFYGELLNRNSSAVIDLPDEYSEYIGVASFEDKAQELINSDKFGEFKSIVNYGNITGYYLKNPAHFYSRLKNAAANGAIINIPYLGKHAVGSGAAPKSGFYFWNIYSAVKSKVFPASLIVMLVLLLIVIWLAFDFKRNYSKTFESKIGCELLALCSLSTIVSLVVTIIFFGMAEISFNLLVFNFLTDLCLIFSVIGGTRLMFIKRSILKEKYGVNQ